MVFSESRRIPGGRFQFRWIREGRARRRPGDARCPIGMPGQPLQTEPPAEAATLEAVPASRRWGIRIRNPFTTLPGRGQPAQREIPEGRFRDATYQRDATYRRTLALADVASAAIAVLVGVAIVGEDALNPVALLALPLVIVVSKLTGLYDRDEHLLRKGTLDEIPALFSVATLYALLIFLAGDLIVDGHFGRDQAVGVWALLFASMVGARALARCYARAVSAEELCIVVGDAKTAGWIMRRFEQAPRLKARVVGRVPLEPEPPSSNGLPLLGRAGALESHLRAEQIERAIVAPRSAVSDDLLNTIRRLKSLGVKVSVLPRLFEVVGSSVELDDVDGITLLGMHRYGLSRSSRAVKRSLDIVGVRARPARARARPGDDRDRDQARVARSGAVPAATHGSGRRALRDAQVPHDGGRRRGAQARARQAQRGRRRALQDRGGSEDHPSRWVPAADLPRRAAPALQRAARRHGPRRARGRWCSTRTAGSRDGGDRGCSSRPG